MEKRPISLSIKRLSDGLLRFKFGSGLPGRWPFAENARMIHLGSIPMREGTPRGDEPGFGFLLKLARCPGIELAPCFVGADGFSVAHNGVEDLSVLIGHLLEIVRSELREDEILETPSGAPLAA